MDMRGMLRNLGAKSTGSARAPGTGRPVARIDNGQRLAMLDAFEEQDISWFWATDHDAEKFSWIDANDAGNNVFSFVRYGPDDSGGRSAVACIANFSAIPHHGYRLGLPYAGRWEEVVNTDATSYGGSGVGNFGAVEANGTPWHGLESSAELSVPPLATVYLRFTG